MISKVLKFALMLAVGSSFAVIDVSAQKGKAKPAPKKTKAVAAKPVQTPDPTLPKVTQVDTVALQNLLKREGENQKPLLVNFWATWCAPCIEEFPDLVKIDNDYKGKIDFITVTLDDVEELNTGVPRFLKRMNAAMPTFLLKTDDEGAAISTVYKDWAGGLPFTIFFDSKGAVVYNRQGKVVDAVLRKELDKVVNLQTTQNSIVELPQPKIRAGEEGRIDAKNDISAGQLKIKRYGMTPAIPQNALLDLKQKYNIEVVENGCVLLNTTADYFTAYNDVMKIEISKKFGKEIIKQLPL